MVRVSAGPHFAVVVTIPRSVNSMVRRAPESSKAMMSRRRDTPVALKASTISPRWRMRAMMAEAAAVLPASMQVPASATTGTPRAFKRRVVVQRLVADLGRYADALAEIGKGQHGAQYLAVEGLALVLRRRIADAEHAADVQHLNDVAGLRASRECGPSSRTAPCDVRARRPRCRRATTFAMRPLVSSKVL